MLVVPFLRVVALDLFMKCKMLILLALFLMFLFIFFFSIIRSYFLHFN